MDNVTKAKINLFAVLRNIQDLCVMDDVSKDIIKNANISVAFIVPEVGEATLIFKNGECKFVANSSAASLKLWFVSPEHFNNLIDGKKTIPLFINIFKAGFLTGVFIKLADRLSYYLKPKPEEKEKLLADKKYFEINTTLTAYTAFFAMCQIGNSDEVGIQIAKRIVDGEISCGIPGGIQVTITKANDKMTAALGVSQNWKAQMQFADLEFAHNLLNGKTSSYNGLGQGKFLIKGKVDMLDQMSKLLNMVNFYLA